MTDADLIPRARKFASTCLARVTEELILELAAALEERSAQLERANAELKQVRKELVDAAVAFALPQPDCGHPTCGCEEGRCKAQEYDDRAIAAEANAKRAWRYANAPQWYYWHDCEASPPPKDANVIYAYAHPPAAKGEAWKFCPVCGTRLNKLNVPEPGYCQTCEAAPPAALREPAQGWKLVPVEPAQGMVINGFECEAFDALMDAVNEARWWPYSCKQAAELVTAIYRAMLDAAPPPPDGEVK